MNPIDLPVSITDNTASPITEQPVNIFPAGQAPNIPEEKVAIDRAKKAQIGMSPFLSQSFDQIYSAIASGNEYRKREESARAVSMLNRQQRLNLIREMTNRGTPLSEEERFAVLSLTQQSDDVDPFSVWEDQYSKQFVAHVNNAFPEERTWIDDELATNRRGFQQKADLASGYISRLQFAKTLEQDVDVDISRQGWGRWSWDLAKTFLPFYSEWNLRNVATKIDTPLLPGENRLAQYDYLLTRDYPEYKALLTQVVNQLKATNPQLAKDFLSGLQGRSIDDRLLDNLFATLDVAGVGEVAILAGRAMRTGNLFKNVIKASTKNTVEPADAIAATGNVEQAAVVKVAEKITKRGVRSPEELFKELQDMMPSLWKGGDMRFTAGGASRELAVRLEQEAARDSANLTSALTDVLRPQALPQELLPQRLEDARQAIKDRFPRADGMLIEIAPIPDRTTPDGLTWVEYKFGKKDATLFSNQLTAQSQAKLYGLDELDYTVKQDGAKYYISIERPLPENGQVTLDSLVTLEKMKTKEGDLIDYMIRKIGVQTPNDVMSDFNMGNRLLATVAPNQFKALVFETISNIKLNTRQAKELGRIMNLARSAIDPETKEYGYWFRTPGEITDAYRQHLKRAATDDEISAYFALVRVQESELVIRNLDNVRARGRLGVEQFQYDYNGPDGAKLKSPWFDGIYTKELPFGDNVNVYWYDAKAKKGRVVDLSKIAGADKKRLETDIAGGKRLIQIVDVSKKPLKESTGETSRIHFMVADGVHSKNLSYIQIPYRGGPHQEYPFPLFMKQIRLRAESIKSNLSEKAAFRRVYEGMTTIMGIRTMAQGKEYAKHINRALKYIADGDESNAQRYVETYLPIEWEEFSSWTKKKTINGVEEPPLLDPHIPVEIVPSGQDILDVDKKYLERFAGAVDSTNDPHDLGRMISQAFTGERDSPLYTINERGSASNPVYKWEPAEVVDAIPMIQRGIGQAIHSHFMDEYKYGGVMAHLEEFADLYNAPREALRQNPFYYFQHGSVNAKGDAVRLQAMKTAKMQILQRLGIETEISSRWNSMADVLANSIYSVGGQGAVEILNPYKLAATRDPTSFFRGIAFHSKLGLGNWVTAFVNLNTFTHISALGGVDAIAGTFGATGMRWLNLNSGPEIVNAMAKKARAFGWKEEDFKESYTWMRNSGWWHVAGEHAFRDDAADPKFFISAAKRYILDPGTIFFRESERMVRLAAWNTAYLNWKKLNPGVALNKDNVLDVLRRADDLQVNMTTASNSLIQKGVTSLPLQFLTYQMRLAEQMFGKRLSVQEKMRLFGMYGMMYGMPVALSTSGIPFYESMRSAALESGVDLQAPAMQLIYEGLPSLIMSLVTGQQMNFAARYGPSGFQSFRDFLYGDSTFWDLALGAAGSITGDILKSASPMYHMAESLLFDGGTSFPVHAGDLIDTAKNVSVVNNTLRPIIAINTGRFISRKGAYLDDVTTQQAIALGVTGMSPLRAQDIHLKSRMIKGFNESIRKGQEDVIREVRRAIDEAWAGNTTEANNAMKRANHYMILHGIPPTMWSTMMSRATADGYGSLADQLDEKFDEMLRNKAMSKEQ